VGFLIVIVVIVVGEYHLGWHARGSDWKCIRMLKYWGDMQYNLGVGSKEGRSF
jgi:hypothetical protein